MLNAEQLDLEYRESALVVVPSTWHEADGLAAVSAWAHGRPVLATKLVGAAIAATKDAVWVVDDDTEALVEGLRRAMADRRELERRGRAARAYYKNKRDPLFTASLVDSYRSVTDSASGPQR